MGRAVAERLTMSELFALFSRSLVDTRWIGCADSEEYLAVVTYLTQRTSRAQERARLGEIWPNGGVYA